MDIGQSLANEPLVFQRTFLRSILQIPSSPHLKRFAYPQVPLRKMPFVDQKALGLGLKKTISSHPFQKTSFPRARCCRTKRCASLMFNFMTVHFLIVFFIYGSVKGATNRLLPPRQSYHRSGARARTDVAVSGAHERTISKVSSSLNTIADSLTL